MRVCVVTNEPGKANQVLSSSFCFSLPLPVVTDRAVETFTDIRRAPEVAVCTNFVGK
jgi:hypothetical protein